MKLLRSSKSFLAAIACVQVFSGAPEIGALDSSLAVRASQGTAFDMPASLRAAVTGFVAQGFYVMSWQRSRFDVGYVVDFYHPNPSVLHSDRDDVIAAARSGLGYSVRKLISVKDAEDAAAPAAGSGLGGISTETGVRQYALSTDRPQIDLATYRGSQLSVNYIALARDGKLLHQTDHRLGERNLFYGESFLCTSVCAVNLIGALVAASGPSADRFHQTAPDIVEIAVKAYPDIFQDKNSTAQQRDATRIEELLTGKVPELPKEQDARRGARSDFVLAALLPLLTKAGARVGHVQWATLDNFVGGLQGKNSIAIVTAEFYEGKGLANPTGVFHAITVLKIDVAEQQIYISDPFRPNLIYREKYEVTPSGHIYFTSDRVGYFPNGSTTFVFRAFQTIEQVAPSQILGALLAPWPFLAA